MSKKNGFKKKNKNNTNLDRFILLLFFFSYISIFENIRKLLKINIEQMQIGYKETEHLPQTLIFLILYFWNPIS